MSLLFKLIGMNIPFNENKYLTAGHKSLMYAIFSYYISVDSLWNKLDQEEKGE